VLTQVLACHLPLPSCLLSCASFCRPDGKQWLKFDDERVEKADANKAIEDNWGGEDERVPPGGEQVEWQGGRALGVLVVVQL
jgi:hypothetical protein